METELKSTQTLCRLCSGNTVRIFQKIILEKYVVKYYKCDKCDSLQTELPYWLDEAYEGANLSSTDTGAAQRNIQNLATVFAIAKLFRFNNLIDIGGGDGLLCRLLRDYEINCFVKDKYATPTYCQGFQNEDFETPDLIISFEVIEHYPNPQDDLDEIFQQKPRAVLLSTEIYSNQDANWWYLSPESGQHVFFYSTKALNYIATKYNYDVMLSGGYALFIRNPHWLKKSLVNLFLKGKMIRLLKAIVVILPTPGVWGDHLKQVAHSEKKE